MNDEQLVSALIASYRARGIDMSYLLSDPLFEKLPGAVKVQAVQAHAKELADGINDQFNGLDYTRAGTSAFMGAAQGALMGIPIGASLAAAAPGGMSPLKAALLAAGALGLTGASLSALKASGGVGQRKALKTSLRDVSVDPSPIAAIGALSSSHMSHESRAFREKLMDKVHEMTSGGVIQQIEPQLHYIHHKLLDRVNTSTAQQP